ncbi:MAG: PHP domain-containing protein, partial [Myxococcota bacterium]
MAGPAPYVELRCATNFSFLRGASHPSEIVEQAAKLGHRRLAITDHNGLYGVVQAFRTGQEHGVEILVGSELHIAGHSGTLIVLATDRASYGRLTRLLSLGRLRVGKGSFHINFADVAAHADGLEAIHVGIPEALAVAREKDVFGDRLALAVERTHTPFDRGRIETAQSASARFAVPLVAVGGVLMHSDARKPLQDILSCVRMGVRLESGGRRLLPNAHAVLRAPQETARIFSDLPEVVSHSVDVADRCAFRLSELQQSFTLEVLPEGETGMGYLRKLICKGAEERYPDGVPPKVQAQIDHELQLIERLDFAGYFLTVWDIVRFARSRNILCQGRGSAANSVVCYCLGITSIDPIRMNLLFERFISAERGEPPDIDVDFEHERREEVMQYVFEKYGRDRAAMVANVIRYRGRLAYREVGKVFGLGDDQIDRLTRTRGYWSGGDIHKKDLREAGLDPDDPTVNQVVRWAEELQGFPRHLGLHSGGFVITKEPLIELA